MPEINPKYETRYIDETSKIWAYAINIAGFLLCIVFPLGVALLIWICFIFDIPIAEGHRSAIAVFDGCGCLVWVIGITRVWYLEIQVEWSRYRIAHDGIHIKYVFSREEVYVPWTEFQAIEIVFRDRYNQIPVICCVRRWEKRNGARRWKTESLKHYKGIYSLMYSPELLAAFEECCPYSIPDLRGTGPYRVWTKKK